MKAMDYVRTAMWLWKPVGQEAAQARLTVMTWCKQCGARHEIGVGAGELREDTMLHQPWCSMDMRNICRQVRVGHNGIHAVDDRLLEHVELVLVERKVRRK